MMFNGSAASYKTEPELDADFTRELSSAKISANSPTMANRNWAHGDRVQRFPRRN